jgi:hypothetical protein
MKLFLIFLIIAAVTTLMEPIVGLYWLSSMTGQHGEHNCIDICNSKCRRTIDVKR